MGQGIVDRQMFIAYILGTMVEADQLALTERYFADDELFDQLLVVENDLLDQYVRGQLSPEERHGFERYLHCLPDSRHKIGVATALMKVISVEQPPAATLPEPTSWWRSILTLAQNQQLLLLYSLAAVFMVSATTVIWLVIYSKQLSRENEQLRAKMTEIAAEQQALEQHTKTFKQQNATQQAQIGQLQKDLEQEQQRSQAQARQIARLQGLSSPLISLELTAASRDPSIPDKLYLTPGTKFVSLIAPLGDRKNYTGYRAVVQTTEGKLVWEKRSTQSPPIGKTIALRLAASQLPPASYKLTLVLRTYDGLDIARDYYFTIAKQ